MTATQIPFENALERLAAEQVSSDSRHARQLARRQLIAEAVMAEGTMRIEDLTERFGISLMTAHRDLDELVSRGRRGSASTATTPSASRRSPAPRRQGSGCSDA